MLTQGPFMGKKLLIVEIVDQIGYRRQSSKIPKIFIHLSPRPSTYPTIDITAMDLV